MIFYWHPIGNVLGIYNLTKCKNLESVIREWLAMEYDVEKFGKPSWELLVRAVAHPVGGKNRKLARNIAKQHNIPLPPPFPPPDFTRKSLRIFSIMSQHPLTLRVKSSHGHSLHVLH